MGRFERLAIATTAGLVLGMFVVGSLYPVNMTVSSPRAVYRIDDSAAKQAVKKITLEQHLDDAFNAVEVNVVAGASIAPSKHLAKSVSQAFQRIGFNLDDVRSGNSEVPPVFLRKMPIDLASLREVKFRKQVFFQTMLPLVLQANDEINSDRERLISLTQQHKQGVKLLPQDRLWLIVLAERYKTKRGNYAELIKRVDTIPVSLALAQAAEESGWGTSRFVHEGNAVFGQWTWSKGQGIVPEGRDEGKTHKIRAFDTLLDSVRAYMKNLNTHRAYRELRRERSAKRKSPGVVNGYQLVGTLIRYSERGEKYVSALRAIINVNKLKRLDRAKLGEPSTLPPIAGGRLTQSNANTLAPIGNIAS